MSKLYRAITLSVMVMTVLSMSMVANVATTLGATAEAGDLIKMEGLSSVYYLGEDGKRYVFPTEDNYFSWYSDFSSVVTIPQDELESYPLGSNVTIRPGTHLVKVTTDPKVYAVEEGGVLRPIPDEDTAETLYGDDWADRVVDVPDAFFVNYTIEDEELSDDTYPQGSLVQPADGNDVYYINADGEAQLIEDESAFEANRFGWDFIVQADEDYELPTVGDEIDDAVDGLIDPSQGASGDTSEDDDEDEDEDEDAGTGLSVALSDDTPSSASIPKGAAKVAFTTINLTASNDGAVTVEELNLERVGVGDEDELGDVYLYEEKEKVGGGENIRENEVEFDHLDYKIPAGETKTLTVRANIEGDSGNHGFAIDKASDVVTNGATASGSFPIKGNLMSLSSVQAGSLTFDFSNSQDHVKIGEKDKELSEFNLSETSSEEDVEVHSVSLVNRGSANTEDAFENFELSAGGDVLAEVESVDSDRVEFILDEPYEIEEGDDEDFTVRADVVGESGRDYKFELDELDDVMAEGQSYGYYVGVEAEEGNLYDENDEVSAKDIEVGELTVDEAAGNPSDDNVARGSDDVTFLKAELTAEDQPLTVTGYEVVVNLANAGEGDASSSEDYLEDLTLYLDGDRIAGPEDVELNKDTANEVTVRFDDEFDLDGTHELEVQADVSDYADYGDYSMTLPADDGEMLAEDENGDRIDSDDDISGDAEGNTVTVGTPDPTLSKDSTYGSQNVVAGEEILAGKFFLEAGESEGLDLDKYIVDLEFGGSNSELGADDIEDLRVNEEDEIAEPATTSNEFYTDDELEAGETKVVEVYLTISDDIDEANADGDTVQTKLDVEGEGVSSEHELDLTAEDGQEMTLRPGLLTSGVYSGTADAAIMLAESEDNDVATWEFEAENTGFDIKNAEVTAFQGEPSDSYDNVNESAVVGMTFGDEADNYPSNGVFEFSDDIEVDKDKKVRVDATADFNNVDNISDDDHKVQFAITNFEFQAGNEDSATEVEWATTTDPDASGSEFWAYVDVDDSERVLGDSGSMIEATSTDEGALDLMYNGETMKVYDSKITVADNDGTEDEDLGDETDSRLQTGEKHIMNLTVTNDGGANESDAILKQFKVDLSSSAGASTTAVRLLDESGSVIKEVDATADGEYTFDSIPEGDGVIGSGDTNVYEIEVTVDGYTDDNDWVSVKVLETGFEWDDDTDSTLDGSLVDTLPGNTYELSR